MFDVDNFKAINDRFGHMAGDSVLATIAAVLLAQSRASDIPVRFGGEEFALLTLESTAVHHEALAERIRAEIARTAVAEIGGAAFTVSAGVAVREPFEKPDSLIARADRALYRAKAAGRNRVCGS
jgi:diguanylate cyclase (GGDEF)-like protein